VSVGPVVFCTTEHLERYDLEGDRQLKGVHVLAQNFRGVQGERVGTLGLVLLPKHRAAQLIRARVPRFCRDALALCYITNGAAVKSANFSSPALVASDYFDTWPLLIDGSRFAVSNPSYKALDSDVQRFKPVWPCHLPPLSVVPFEFLDEPLRAGVDKAIQGFISGRSRRALRQIFRAIAMACHASRQLQETDSSWHDLGTRIVQWVSAFETLVHPGRRKVGQKEVRALINCIEWPIVGKQDGMGRFVGRKYSVGYQRYRCKNRGREGAASHYFGQLYDLRNAFAHGNIISQRKCMVLERPDGRRVDWPAPLLFRECLMQRLRQVKCVPGPPIDTMSAKELDEYSRLKSAQAWFDKGLARMLLLPRRLQAF